VVTAGIPIEIGFDCVCFY